MSERETVVFIGIGSNVGDKVGNCRCSVQKLSDSGHFRRLTLSSWYLSAPVGYVEQEWFVNGVLQASTSLAPLHLLEVLQEVERSLGKNPPFRWGPRTIDLDLLLYGDELVDEPRLRVPHPRMAERRFVLEPLTELAPKRIHPCLGREFTDLLAELPPDPRVVRLNGSASTKGRP